MKHILNLTGQLLLAVLLVTGALPQKSIAQENTVTEGELEQILAPVALYPDTVLSHILIAATYPVDVVQAARWSKANRDLTPSAAVAAVETKSWDPSVKALVAFPQILKRMNENLEWTERLGQAFLQDEARVMTSVQTLRERAYASGSLESLEHLRVEREAETIVIEPVQKQIVYIPYYDTREVYGDWRWHDHPPVYWGHPTYVLHRPGSGFYWSSGVHAPPSIFFSSFHWRRGHVIVVDLYPHPVHFYSHRDIVHHRDAHRWQHHRHRDGYRSHRPDRRYGDDNFGDDRGRDFIRHTLQWRERRYPHASRPTQQVITVPPGRSHSGRVITSGRDDDRQWRNDQQRRRVPEQDTRPPAGVIQQHPAHRNGRVSPGSGGRSTGHVQSPHRLIRENQ